AQKMHDSFKPAPAKKTDAGAPAPSAAKAVTTGSTPMASTARELSTPTARAKTVVGSTIIAETIASPGSTVTEAKTPASATPPTNRPETMGSRSARLPERAQIQSGTEEAN